MVIKMDKDKVYRTAAICVIGVTATAALYIAVRFAAPLFMPFLLAALTAALIRPISAAISKRSRIPKKLCACTVTALLLFFIVYILVSIGGVLFREVSGAVSSLLREFEQEDNIIRRVFLYFSSLKDNFPLNLIGDGENSALTDQIYAAVMDAARSGAAKLSESVTSFAASFIGSLPGFIFSLVVYVIALFYFTADPEGISAGVKRLVPGMAGERAAWLKDGIIGALSGYLRAYLVLLVLTFGELLLGFVILRVRYALLAAALIAVIDILPVLGVGTVLLPWASWSLLTHNYGRGVGLLVLFVIMYAIRQFAEPRLIGKFMGIHPLIALAAAFAGLKLFGIFGMITLPLILYVVKLWAEERETDGV